jgi:hypothetical protein
MISIDFDFDTMPMSHLFYYRDDFDMTMIFAAWGCRLADTPRYRRFSFPHRSADVPSMVTGHGGISCRAAMNFIFSFERRAHGFYRLPSDSHRASIPAGCRLQNYLILPHADTALAHVITILPSSRL